ncbi:hypothetical protein [Pseudobutyrivibrio sp.]|uniref:hypothetical protein n=1 Tax=Pseudobutyrivibrio sp. TaxID=2014367 RepID=UPI0025F33BAD|nr:hypothetical protein [Pseudobutyrivibrio sp.]
METLLGFVSNKYCIAYIVVVTIGFLFRIGIVSPLVSSAEDSKKRTIREIGIVLILTLFWSLGSENESTQNVMAFLSLTVFYLGYVLNKRAGKDGYIKSLLVFISGYFITAMSFMSFPINLILGIITVVLAVIVYCKLEPYRKSAFWEIIVMVVETVAISIFVWLNNWNDAFSITLVVIFIETAIYMFNIFIGCVIVAACKEDVDKYINSIKGLDDYID